MIEAMHICIKRKKRKKEKKEKKKEKEKCLCAITVHCASWEECHVCGRLPTILGGEDLSLIHTVSCYEEETKQCVHLDLSYDGGTGDIVQCYLHL